MRAGSPVRVLPEAQSLVPSLQGQKLVLRRDERSGAAGCWSVKESKGKQRKGKKDA